MRNHVAKIILGFTVVILCLLAWNAYSIRKNQNEFGSLTTKFSQESIPGEVEIYSVQERGSLDLNNRGSGDVAIGINSIEADRNFTGKKEHYYVSMIVYTYISGETTAKQNFDLYIGDETEFGGYHIAVKDLFFQKTGFLSWTDVVFLEIRAD